MKSVLIFPDAWQGPIVLDTSTPELRDQAFLQLFRFLDERLQAYRDLGPEEFQLWSMARRGNAKHAQALLLLRCHRSEERFVEAQVGLDLSGRPGDQLRLTINVPCPEALEERNIPKEGA